MNATHDELELRRRLRALSREREPANDLWPTIAERIGRTPARRSRWLLTTVSLMAASLVLALGLIHNFAAVAPAGNGIGPAEAERWQSQLVRREADAISVEYQRASAPLLSEPLPDAIRGAVVELDDSSARIREALRSQPDATYLLERLRRTQERRLHLLQRVALG